jgi:hypothetical protein
MADKTCINHDKTPATIHCYQCHKPLCQQCVMVTPHGSFCSSTCSVTYKEMKEHLKGSEGGKKGGVGGLIVKLAVAAVLILIGIHLAVRFGQVSALEGVDVIGKFLPVSK